MQFSSIQTPDILLQVTQDYYQGLRASLSFKHNNSHNAHHKLKDVEITFVQKQKQIELSLNVINTPAILL